VIKVLRRPVESALATGIGMMDQLAGTWPMTVGAIP
jgi:hypothetical protein